MTEPTRGTAPGTPAQDRLTHIDEAGAARMVDVSEKDVTARTARASGRVLVSPRVVELLRGEGVPKGGRPGHGTHRGHHGRQTHPRSDPAVPPPRPCPV
ncbi:hypothetical protein GCM10020256_44670 [Streptomyces thermocoprophilus]